MASMAPAPDMSLLSSHFNKIAGTGDMRSSSPHSSLASFCNSFVNSPSSYQTLGSPATYPAWCGQSVDSHLIATENPVHNKVKSQLGATLVEHSLSGSKGNSAVLQHLGSTVESREWQQVEATKACLYGGSMASLLSTPAYTRARAPRSSGNRVHHMTEGAMIRELIDRMGGSNNPANIPSLGVSISHRPGHPMEKLLNLGSSSCPNAPSLTNDPSKLGGLALKGVGLATSRSLAQFSSDPGFTPLAAKFSPFCSNANYPQAPQPTIPLLTDDRATDPRSEGVQQAHESNGKLSPTSSTVGVVKIGGECISSFQNSLEGTGVNTGAQDAQATRVRMISDDEKELSGDGNSLPSLEAIEGARKNSVADEAAGLESFDPGEDTSFVGEPLEKKRKKFTPDDRGHASLCLESAAFENDNTKPKRCKMEDGAPRKTTKEEVQKPKADGSYNDNSDNDSSQGKSKEMNTGKLSHADLCKQDYIHVRARRGQATDSHSLAERIRREKISERMKHLQGLVPGCSKVTGKAVMLDEIINYVQSLQRQVEHLSMRLATAPPEMDVNFDTVSTKEMMQQSCGATGPTDYASFFSHNAKQQETVSLLDTIGAYALDFRGSLNGNLETGSNCGVTQGSTMWDGDLQSIVQMGILQCGPTSLVSQGFNGHFPVSKMKVEL